MIESMTSSPSTLEGQIVDMLRLGKPLPIENFCSQLRKNKIVVGAALQELMDVGCIGKGPATLFNLMELYEGPEGPDGVEKPVHVPVYFLLPQKAA